jgi:hypothetical protein
MGPSAGRTKLPAQPLAAAASSEPFPKRIERSEGDEGHGARAIMRKLRDSRPISKT